MTDHNARQAGLTLIREKLARFVECVEDDEDTDIGREYLDALTTLGLLARTQRSPAQWCITDAGSDFLAAHSADARNGEGVALTDAVRELILWARSIFCVAGWEGDEWVKRVDALLAAPAAPASTCTRCDYIGKCDCEIGAAPAAKSEAASQPGEMGAGVPESTNQGGQKCQSKLNVMLLRSVAPVAQDNTSLGDVSRSTSIGAANSMVGSAIRTGDGEAQNYRTADGMPTERAVLEREWRKMRDQLAALPAASAPYKECGASGQGCSYRPHGPNGEMQCQYCGEAAPAPAAQADDDDDEGTGITPLVEWDRLPGWLIDHHEGEILTEELLQHALADMLKVYPAQQSATPAECTCPSGNGSLRHPCPVHAAGAASQPGEMGAGVDLSKLERCDQGFPDMNDSPNGAYVLFSDVEELLAGKSNV